ncbi:MAG: hypothetical protein U0350_11355 [Caldilineaceae bacterium]
MIQATHARQRPALAAPVDITQIARRYVTTQLGATFVISRPRLLHEENIWWILVQYQAAGQSRPIGVGRIRIDAQTGEVLPLSHDEIQVMCEKAALLEAKQCSTLPLDAQGYVLGEYARKQANRYLWDQLSMYYRATDLVLVPGEPPLWQVTIVFKMYDLGPFPLGVMTVNGKSGQPIPLTTTEVEKIRERVHAITGHQAAPANPS